MPQEDWDRAAAIKRGEEEWPGYDSLKAWIQQTPATMLPGLLAQIVTCCLAENVYQPGKIQEIVMLIETHWNRPGHGVLREEQK